MCAKPLMVSLPCLGMSIYSAVMSESLRIPALLWSAVCDASCMYSRQTLCRHGSVISHTATCGVPPLPHVGLHRFEDILE